MRTQEGRRDEVVEILLAGAGGLGGVGCRQYAVGVDPADADLIWVSEIWDSPEDHQASLQLPEAKAAIARAMPMLTGDFTRREYTVVGGLGVAATGS